MDAGGAVEPSAAPDGGLEPTTYEEASSFTHVMTMDWDEKSVTISEVADYPSEPQHQPRPHEPQLNDQPINLGPGALEPAGQPTIENTAVGSDWARYRRASCLDSADSNVSKSIDDGVSASFEKLPTSQSIPVLETAHSQNRKTPVPSQPANLASTGACGNGLLDGSSEEQPMERYNTASTTDFDYPEGGFRANLVVFGAFSGMFSAFGFMNTIGTLQAYISTHQLAAYNESSVGWIFSLYIFLAFFGGIQVGPAFDRWGPRGLVAAGSVLLVAGEVALANATTFAHFVISLSLLCGLGSTLIITPCISAIAHWFCVKRATMTGFAATGGSIGGVLFPMLLPNLFDSIGWTWALRLMALVNLVACVISIVFLAARLPPKRGTSVRPDFTIFRNLAFTLTTAGVFAMEWGLFVPLTFFSSWALGAGLGSPPHSSTFPFQVLAILNGASFFGRWLPGLAADRWGRFNILAASMAGSLLFLVAAWLPAILLEGGGGGISATRFTGAVPYDSVRTGLSILFALGFGFFFGAGISLTPVCVGELCDPRDYGRWYSTCYSVVSFGCLTGVPIAGVVLGEGGTRGWASLVAWTSACYAVSLTCFVAARIAKAGWNPRSAV